MTSVWAKTSVSEDRTLVHNWQIEELDKMMTREGKVESPRFSIPGLLGEFWMKVQILKDVGRDPQMPRGLMIEGSSQKTPITWYFQVTIEGGAEGTLAAGLLELAGEGWNATGRFGEPEGHNLQPADADGSWKFIPDQAVQYLYLSNANAAYYPEKGSGFYTEGVTTQLTMKTTLTLPGKTMATSGTAESQRAAGRLFDFRPLLACPKDSDILLKCGDKSFQCHKAILRTRSAVFDVMLDSDMTEARRGEVEIKDLEPNTLERMVKFIYTGELEDKSDLGDLLYAGDKYELTDLVQLCANDFMSELASKAVDPAAAVEILLLADRHSLAGLKQAVMLRIMDEKARFMAAPEFLKGMEGNPKLWVELFAMS